MISERTKQKLLFGDEGERQLAAKKLAAKMSAEARELLVQQLRSEKHPAVLEWLCIGVRYCMAFEAAEPLMQLLHNSTGDVRRFACEALGKVGSEKCVSRLEITASVDSDYHVRLAAIKALAGIGIRLLGSALEVMDALKRVQKANKGDLALAAGVARNDVEQALLKTQAWTLFDSAFDQPLEPSDKSKKKDLEQLVKYLRSHDVAPEEARYTVSVTRTIVRNKSLRKRCAEEGWVACQICETPFFKTKSDELSFQMAHIKPLKDGGSDANENTIFLCANCHAEMDMAADTVKKEGNKISISLPSHPTVHFVVEKGKTPKRIG